MKMLLSTMCLSGLLFGSLWAAEPSDAAGGGKQVPFDIRTIQRATKATAYVEETWQRNVPCIEANIRTTEDLGSARPFIKAYFFNREKAVVAKYDKPAQAGDRVGGVTRIPEYLKPKEYYNVYFPVTARAREGKDRWAHVIVVIGEGNRAVARIYPDDDISAYDFDEKGFALSKGKRITSGVPKTP